MLEAMEASARQNGDWRHLFIDSKANAQALTFFGLSEKDLPAYVIHDASNNADDKYVSKKAKPDSLDAHLAKFRVRSLLPACCWLTAAVMCLHVRCTRCWLLAEAALRQCVRRAASWRRLSSLKSPQLTTTALSR